MTSETRPTTTMLPVTMSTTADVASMDGEITRLRAEVERLREALADKERSLTLAEVRHESDGARIHGLVTEIEELRGRAYDDKLRIERSESLLAGRDQPPSAPSPRYDRATVERVRCKGPDGFPHHCASCPADCDGKSGLIRSPTYDRATVEACAQVANCDPVCRGRANDEPPCAHCDELIAAIRSLLTAQPSEPTMPPGVVPGPTGATSRSGSAPQPSEPSAEEVERVAKALHSASWLGIESWSDMARAAIAAMRGG